MINWLVRHIDAIEDRIKAWYYKDNTQDIMHIFNVIGEVIYISIKAIFYFFIAIVVLELCWCILN